MAKPGALCRILDEAAGTVAEDGGAAHTADALRAAASSLAAQLRADGLTPDEPVIVAVANRAADLASFFGVWQAGGVAVPLHAGAAEMTRATILEQTGARFLVADGTVTRLAETPPPARPLLDGAALIVFTSGSTGKPKGVVLAHDRFAGKLDALQDLLALTPNDKVVLPLQLIFIFGLWVALLSLKTGARLELVGKFTPAGLKTRLPDTTVLATVPSMLRTLFGEGEVAAPQLRTILTGGEGLGTHLAGAIATQLPCAGVFDLYGLTETGSCDFCLRPADAETGRGSIGRPTPGIDYLISDDPAAGATGAGPDAAGELLIRTPFGMIGYLDNPDLTQTAFRDGFFRTGDVARRRPDGCVEIVGRIKEIVSRGGNKIAPAEIETVLCAHPAVAQALAAGVPDPRLGEALHAAVVLRAGSSASADELRAWCAARIERFKVPDAIHVVAALPTGPTGKAYRPGIRALADAAVPTGTQGR
ncbi:class I adenylate-forming enzyme family protein [Xanthobacter aminoxidans]|uniref:class I adenylate-forming enzyme family protein n=1 Tax=Xanthobacter aminoxidans TaxID=186280 RepID=UPI002022CBD2|nr:AMP-binding protein [Xanthobacter aminoxidans]MCL8382557.1 AMP-binding protein [Xanthobacter aminoxidans]